MQNYVELLRCRYTVHTGRTENEGSVQQTSKPADNLVSDTGLAAAGTIRLSERQATRSRQAEGQSLSPQPQPPIPALAAPASSGTGASEDESS